MQINLLETSIFAKTIKWNKSSITFYSSTFKMVVIYGMIYRSPSIRKYSKTILRKYEFYGCFNIVAKFRFSTRNKILWVKSQDL